MRRIPTAVLCAAMLTGGISFPEPKQRPVRQPIDEDAPPKPLTARDLERIEAAKAKRARRAAKRRSP